jgi:hypothetical protein
MRLEPEMIATLPRLAWCARLERASRTVWLLHGRDVETGSDWFCEGAWSGDFASPDFSSRFLMGSGGRLGADGLLVASPSHTMERIWALRLGRTLLVSNSCAFLFAQSGDRPDARYLHYLADLTSIIKGLDRYVRTIPTRLGNRVGMYCHCNLWIDRRHRIREYPKPAVRDFVSYPEYASFLRQTIAAIGANAAHPARRVRYRPIATISSGYDSPASAVLARSAGCTEAITVRRTRPRDGADKDDSGEEIGRLLGMAVRVYDRLDYRRLTGFPEAEAGISEILSFADALEGRLLFTGFNDVVWDRLTKDVGPYIRRKDASGNHLAELRLRLGFIHLAVPYLGCTSHASIHRISTSEEMRAWSVSEHYDRPIARRLVEEAGVPRGMFGVEKKAVAVAAHLEGFDRTMTEESFADFSRFLGVHRTPRLAAAIGFYRTADQMIRPLAQAWNRRVGPISSRIGRPLAISVPPSHVERPGQWGANTLFFHWAMDKLIPRYATPAAWRAREPPTSFA